MYFKYYYFIYNVMENKKLNKYIRKIKLEKEIQCH